MRVFILCTGRCGSNTFSMACEHITNFTSGHETNRGRIGPSRIAYPDDHIEIDNRLSWFLGRLHDAFGNEARYVHLVRAPHAVAESLDRTWDRNKAIMPAYRDRIVDSTSSDGIDVCRDYIETVTANIRLFLRDKTHVMEFRLEKAQADFARFWSWIGAEGDYDAALAEWSIRHNSTEGREARRHRKMQKARRPAWLRRVLKVVTAPRV